MASSVLWDGGKAFGRAARKRSGRELAQLRKAVAAGAGVDIKAAALSGWLRDIDFWVLLSATQSDDTARTDALRRLQEHYLPSISDVHVAQVVSILLVEVSLGDAPLRQRLVEGASFYKLDVLEHSVGFVLSEVLDAIFEVRADLHSEIEQLRATTRDNRDLPGASSEEELDQYLMQIEAWAEARLRSLWGLRCSVTEFQELVLAWHSPQWFDDDIVRYTDRSGGRFSSVLECASNRIIVTGGPGSGKSMVLVSELVSAARRGRKVLTAKVSDARVTVPIFVRSGDLNASHKTFVDLCNQPTPILINASLAAWIWSNESLDVLVLLDALDECVLGDERLGDLMNSLVSRPNVRIVATGRVRPANIEEELHIDWSDSGLEAVFLAYLDAIASAEFVTRNVDSIVSGSIRSVALQSPLHGVCVALTIARYPDIDHGIRAIDVEGTAIDAILNRQADKVSVRYGIDHAERMRLLDLARDYLERIAVASHNERGVQSLSRMGRLEPAMIAATQEIQAVASGLFDEGIERGRRLLHASFEAHLCASALSRQPFDEVKLELAAGNRYTAEVVARVVVLGPDPNERLSSLAELEDDGNAFHLLLVTQKLVDLTRPGDWSQPSRHLIDRHLAVKVRAELAMGGEGLLTDPIGTAAEWELERTGIIVLEEVLPFWKPLLSLAGSHEPAESWILQAMGALGRVTSRKAILDRWDVSGFPWFGRGLEQRLVEVDDLIASATLNQLFAAAKPSAPERWRACLVLKDLIESAAAPIAERIRDWAIENSSTLHCRRRSKTGQFRR